MAVTLSWTGYVDTDLSFSEFASADHSILMRFMAHIPTRTKVQSWPRTAPEPSPSEWATTWQQQMEQRS